MDRSACVRGCLVGGLGLVLLAALGIPPAEAQIGRPRTPPGFPTPPGAPPGMGGPGMGGPRMPGPVNPFNRPDPFDRGPRFPGPGGLEKVWFCSGCKFELGRGAVMPAVDRCPSCGAKFANGLNLPELGPPPGMAGPGEPGGLPGNNAGPLAHNPTPPRDEPPIVFDPLTNPPSNPAADDSTTSSGLSSGVVVRILLGVGVLVVAGLLGVVALVVFLISRQHPVPAKKRRRRLDDDDD